VAGVWRSLPVTDRLPAGSDEEDAVRIAIDGPGASGKSAVGSRVAARLGFPFIDTGAMYRAITWLALERGVPITDTTGLAALARSAPVEVTTPPPGSREFATIRIGGMDATPHLREYAVERGVSPVSAVPEVREVMVDLQRRAANARVVMAGRDIGTVVLPDAEVKVYLVASPEVRARRRVEELTVRGESAHYASVLSDLRRRDEIDSTRAVAPLRPADDATVINTDRLEIDAVVSLVLDLVRARQKAWAKSDPAPTSDRP
jgi:cytidylate kinase